MDKAAFNCPAILQEDEMATKAEYMDGPNAPYPSNYANSMSRALGKETYCGNDFRSRFNGEY